jgi:protein-disulfide isomerase
MDVAREIGVSGTPSLVVRGAIYTGLAGVRELERWVREVVG